MDMSKAEKFTLQYHSANPNMCRIPELKIKQLHECEGGGWYMRREQAEEIVAAVNAYDPKRDAVPVSWRLVNGSDDTIAWYSSESAAIAEKGSYWPSARIEPLYTKPFAQRHNAAFEAMREALMIIAGKRQCLDNLMGNVDVALAALALANGEG